MQKRTPWETYYNLLCQVYKELGSIDFKCNMPYVREGLNLSAWLRRQRNNYSKGILSADQIPKLEALGFVWNGREVRALRNAEEWDRIFLIAKAYYDQHGDLRVPRNFVMDGVDIGSWLTNIKTAYKGKSKRRLTEYQISHLESIGIEWNFDYKEDLWNRMYQCTQAYYNEHGDIFIPQGLIYDGLNLGSWIHDQTQARKKGKLSSERIAKLDALGIRWNLQQDKWIQGQRIQKKKAKNYSQNRIDCLESIGMVWAIR